MSSPSSFERSTSPVRPAHYDSRFFSSGSPLHQHMLDHLSSVQSNPTLLNLLEEAKQRKLQHAVSEARLQKKKPCFVDFENSANFASFPSQLRFEPKTKEKKTPGKKKSKDRKSTQTSAKAQLVKPNDKAPANVYINMHEEHPQGANQNATSTALKINPIVGIHQVETTSPQPTAAVRNPSAVSPSRKPLSIIQFDDPSSFHAVSLSRVDYVNHFPPCSSFHTHPAPVDPPAPSFFAFSPADADTARLRSLSHSDHRGAHLEEKEDDKERITRKAGQAYYAYGNRSYIRQNLTDPGFGYDPKAQPHEAPAIQMPQMSLKNADYGKFARLKAIEQQTTPHRSSEDSSIVTRQENPLIAPHLGHLLSTSSSLAQQISQEFRTSLSHADYRRPPASYAAARRAGEGYHGAYNRSYIRQLLADPGYGYEAQRKPEDGSGMKFLAESGYREGYKNHFENEQVRKEAMDRAKGQQRARQLISQLKNELTVQPSVDEKTANSAIPQWDTQLYEQNSRNSQLARAMQQGKVEEKEHITT